jgi:hypothetical protein
MLSTLNNLVFGGGPILISLAAFMTYSSLGHPLTAAVAFPALSLFNLLRFPLFVLPTQARVAPRPAPQLFWPCTTQAARNECARSPQRRLCRWLASLLLSAAVT